jgi:hypothetical protein
MQTQNIFSIFQKKDMGVLGSICTNEEKITCKIGIKMKNK